MSESSEKVIENLCGKYGICVDPSIYKLTKMGTHDMVIKGKWRQDVYFYFRSLDNREVLIWLEDVHIDDFQE